MIHKECAMIYAMGYEISTHASGVTQEHQKKS